MTDNTQPEAREFTMSQYASKDDMIGAMRKRIAELEAQLEPIRAGGVQALSAAPAVHASVKGAMWFTKKPVTIQAIQWTGDNLREVITFTDGPPDTRSHHAGMAWDAYRDLVARDGLKIYTLEGKMLASPGDWIIRGVKGELYPCKPDIFQETYAAASPTPPAEQQASATEVALVGAYARLPDFDSGDEPIWEAVFKWKAANPGSDASKKAMAVEGAIIKSLRDFADRTHALRMQAAPKAAPGVGNSGFDHQTAADFLSGKTVSDEAVRKFVAASRWAHDERAALSATLLAMHGVLTSREAEIALLKKALLEAEAAPKQEAQEPVAWESTTPGFIKYITQARYEKFSPNVQRWYKPYKCSSCAAPQPAPAELERLRERISKMGLDVDRAMRGHVNEQSPLGTTRLAAIAALAKPAPAPLSDDTKRLDWLDRNIFSREMSEWDAKYGHGPDYNMWVVFSPKGVQGSARNIIDAALAAQGGKDA